MDGISKSAKTIKCWLIGQLAKNENYKDEEKIIKFYKDNDFEILQKSNEIQLIQMIKVI